jgi:hypothetical protein
MLSFAQLQQLNKQSNVYKGQQQYQQPFAQQKQQPFAQQKQQPYEQQQQQPLNNEYTNTIQTLFKDLNDDKDPNLDLETKIISFIKNTDVKSQPLILNYDINVEPNKFETPLYIASKKGKKGIVEALINTTYIYINKGIVDRNLIVDTPLNVAANQEIKKLIEDNGGNTTTVAKAKNLLARTFNFKFGSIYGNDQGSRKRGGKRRKSKKSKKSKRRTK